MLNSPTNPIIAGFAPDPSVISVDGWYYLVNSTFHMFPGLPIYASRDLVSWRHIANAISRRDQLSLNKSDTKLSPVNNGADIMLATGGLYAPTIRYRSGTFYVVCTNIVRGEEKDTSANFIVTTQDIWNNEWSDPVYFEFNGIDPSILFDGDKAYLHASAAPGPSTKINIFEIDLKTGKKLSEERTIWEGTGGIYPEGPHLYKRNGWYYLVIAEGGTHEGHMVTMARSRDIWGPYDSCPNNPILTAKNTNEYIQYTGHCEAFQDHSGQWWGVCLGVRKDGEGRIVMGRETFLTKGNWDGEWLSLETVKSDIAHLLPANSSPSISAVANIDYLYIRDANLGNYKIQGGSSITLKASPVDLSHPETSPTFIGKRQRKLNGQSSVTIPPLAKAAISAGLGAGIACYKDEHRYLRIFYDAANSAVVFELNNKAKGIVQSERHRIERIRDDLNLKIAYNEKEYRLLYRIGQISEQDWVCLASTDTLNMTGPDFVGPVIGIFAVADSENVEVDFRDFHVE